MQVITRLIGGLGNQLFQYAAGRSLSAKLGVELVLDDSLLRQHRSDVTYREYALDAYQIRGRKICPDENRAVQARVRRPVRYLIEAGLLRSPYTYYREPHFQYDPKLFEVSGNVIIEGYWQSERYFSDIAHELRKELQPVTPLLTKTQGYLEQIKRQNSVSMHVRRGDYVSLAGAAATYATCDLHYYRRAVDIVAQRVPNPVFFVFSDAPEWVKENLMIDYPMVLVSQPDVWPDYEDLRLMSYCSHNIIANSSFSWWGAWLNIWPDKIVVAPSKWFKNDKETCDLIPSEWIVT